MILLERFLRLFRPEDAPIQTKPRSKGVTLCPICDKRVSYYANGYTSRHACREGVVGQVHVLDERLRDVK